MKIEEQGRAFDDWAKSNVENYCDAIFDGRYYVMRENSRLNKEKKNFLILSLNLGLKSWLASANRQGYKLVPVTANKDMLKAGYDAHNDFFFDGQVQDVYKAMIGACDE